MTDVRIRMRRPGTAAPVRAEGVMLWSPTRAATAPEGLLLPAPLRVTLAAGSDATLAGVTPCDGTQGWCWVAQTWVDSTIVDTRAVLVPTTSAVLDLEDLAVVDSATLTPARNIPAWEAAVTAIQQAVATVPSLVAGNPDLLAAAVALAQSDAGLLRDHGQLGTADLDTITTPGTHVQQYNSNATTARHYPVAARGGLVVTALGGGVIRQEYSTSYGESRMFTREISGSTPPAWTEVGGVAARDMGALGALDLNEITTPGIYRQQSTGNATPERHYPKQSRGVLQIFPVDTGSAQGIVQVYRSTWLGGVATRERYNGVWFDWNTDATVGYPGNPTMRTVREADMRRRLGHISTDGKAAVALVFEHGLERFQDIVWPALQARGLRATLALNMGQFDVGYQHAASNGEVTWTDIQGWASAGLEIANHTRTHRGAATVAQMRDEIQVSRQDLENAVGQPIDSFIQIGIPSGDSDYSGFGQGSTPEAYYSTDAGRMILDAHVATTGSIYQPGYVYALDGTIPVGVQGKWLDAGTTAALNDINASINIAVARPGRTVVRCHPEKIGASGGITITTAKFEEFLDDLASRRDAGELVVLPFREWAIATL